MPSLVCHLTEDGLYGLLCGHARNIKLIQYRRDLRAAVSQNSQRRDNVVHGSARLNLRRRYAYLRNALVYLILQLKRITRCAIFLPTPGATVSAFSLLFIIASASLSAYSPRE